MIQMKLKKCVICGKEYEPRASFQKVCSMKCAIDHPKESAKKKKSQSIRREKKEFYAKDKKFQMALAVKACNEYIRARDRGIPCISCDKPDDGSHQRHASHYRPGTNSALKFHEFNVNASCQQCNTEKSGNLTAYRPKLIDKIGVDAVEWLEGDSCHRGYKYTLEDVIEIKEYYREKLKSLKENRFV